MQKRPKAKKTKQLFEMAGKTDKKNNHFEKLIRNFSI